MDKIMRIAIVIGLLVLAGDIYCFQYSRRIMHKEMKEMNEEQCTDCSNKEIEIEKYSLLNV